MRAGSAAASRSREGRTQASVGPAAAPWRPAAAARWSSPSLPREAACAPAYSGCSLVLTFTPSGNGTRSSTLSIAYNDGAASQMLTRQLTATSTTAAILSVADSPYGGGGQSFDYGTTGLATDHTFTVSNLGA